MIRCMDFCEFRHHWFMIPYSIHIFKDCAESGSLALAIWFIRAQPIPVFIMHWAH